MGNGLGFPISAISNSGKAEKGKQTTFKCHAVFGVILVTHIVYSYIQRPFTKIPRHLHASTNALIVIILTFS